jgi:hypothetical protein
VLILSPTDSDSDLQANVDGVSYKRRDFQQLLDASKPSLTKDRLGSERVSSSANFTHRAAAGPTAGSGGPKITAAKRPFAAYGKLVRRGSNKTAGKVKIP